MEIVKFWGVQGSSPGNRFKDNLGSNTPCVSIEYDDNLIILDAGTGIKSLSSQLNAKNYKNIILLITHSHWDHIQGFPFFNFIHTDCEIKIFSHNQNHIDAMLNQINGINFPLNLHDIQAKITSIKNINEIEMILNISISTIQTNHHGDCIGYRLKRNGLDLCFLPDNQLHNPQQTMFNEFVNFCKNTKLLIHDCQYTEKDMPGKENWGHSIVEDAYRLCTESESEKLILFHHDPEREKKDILAIEETYNNKSAEITTIAAYEGLEIVLLGN